jgi:hypothetical protein
LKAAAPQIQRPFLAECKENQEWREAFLATRSTQTEGLPRPSAKAAVQSGLRESRGGHLFRKPAQKIVAARDETKRWQSKNHKRKTTGEATDGCFLCLLALLVAIAFFHSGFFLRFMAALRLCARPLFPLGGAGFSRWRI